MFLRLLAIFLPFEPSSASPSVPEITKQAEPQESSPDPLLDTCNQNPNVIEHWLLKSGVPTPLWHGLLNALDDQSPDALERIRSQILPALCIYITMPGSKNHHEAAAAVAYAAWRNEGVAANIATVLFERGMTRTTEPFMLRLCVSLARA
jgi:hypothetical protein